MNLLDSVPTFCPNIPRFLLEWTWLWIGLEPTEVCHGMSQFTGSPLKILQLCALWSFTH